MTFCLIGAVPFTIDWKDGHRFCQSEGANWRYQLPLSWLDPLRVGVVQHFENWRQGNTDKQNHTLFTSLAGSGNGKSRNLDNFRETVLESIKDVEGADELRHRISEAFVLKLNFENGTSGTAGGDIDPAVELGIRAMFQLCQENIDFGHFRTSPDAQVPLEAVLAKIADLVGKPQQELTFLVLVDGLQSLPHEHLSKTSMLYRVIGTLSNLTCQSTAFVICCCAGALFLPVQDVLAESRMLRQNLVPEPLDPSKIFSEFETSPLVRLLSLDMGGHGRALEALHMVLDGVRSRRASDIIPEVIAQLKSKYPDWCLDGQPFADEVLLASLSHREFPSKTDVVSGSTIDAITSLGLVRYEKPFLKVPYVLVMFKAAMNATSDIHKLWLDDYHVLDACFSLDPEHSKMPWQHFELLCQRFRAVKSLAFSDGVAIAWKKVHCGATFGPDCDVSIISHPLQARSALERHEDITALVEQDVYCKDGALCSVSSCRDVILNASSAEAGDAFLGLQLQSADLCVESLQMKHEKANLTNVRVQRERRKACLDKDFFVMFSTARFTGTVNSLPARTAVVDRKCWEQYFGPFVGRAFVYSAFHTDANVASYDQLVMVDGIGDGFAKKILEKRQERPFHSPEDCSTRTHLPMRIAKKIVSKPSCHQQ